MKSVLGMLVLMMAVGVASAQEKPKAKGNQAETKKEDRQLVTVTADMISVEKAVAFDLVRLDSATLWAKLSEMVKSGTATSEYLQSVGVISGDRAVIECIEEFRYPTEFEMEGSSIPSGGQDTKAIDAKPNPVVADPAGLIPSGFETRNMGAVMEVAPTVAGNKIHLEIVPANTRLKEFVRYPSGNDKPGRSAEQPIFRFFKVQSNFLVSSGIPCFAGAGPLDPSGKPNPEARWLFFFVTATIAP